MKCPNEQCGFENVPVRETSMSVRHPSHCGQCGEALTAQCVVCLEQHPIGTKFCLNGGTDVDKWLRERNTWRRVVQEAYATVTVRPLRARLSVLGANVTGVFVGIVLSGLPNWPGSSGSLVVTSAFVGVAIALFGSLVALLTLRDRAHQRRRELFSEQGFTVFKPTYQNLWLKKIG